MSCIARRVHVMNANNSCVSARVCAKMLCMCRVICECVYNSIGSIGMMMIRALGAYACVLVHRALHVALHIIHNTSLLCCQST